MHFIHCVAPALHSEIVGTSSVCVECLQLSDDFAELLDVFIRIVVLNASQVDTKQVRIARDALREGRRKILQRLLEGPQVWLGLLKLLGS